MAVDFKYLWEYVDEWSKLQPNKLAIRYYDRVYTFNEFNEITERLSRAFLSMGVSKGDRVVTILPSIPEYVFTLIASNKLGAVVVPLDVRYREADIKRFLSHVEPKIVVTLDRVEDNDILGSLIKLQQDIGTDLEYIVVGDTFDFGISFQEIINTEHFFFDELEELKATQEPDEGALIIFTGGTTGIPKAALLSHRNVSLMCAYEDEYINNLLKSLGVEGRFKTLVSLPPSHVGGTLENIGTALVGGLEMVMLERWSPYQVLETMINEEIPLFGGVPTMYSIVLNLPDLGRFDFSCIKLVVLSGEKVSLELIEDIRNRLCRNIVVGYGSTEAGAEVTFTTPDVPSEKLAEGYVGKPLPGVEIQVVDEDDNPLPLGKVGEVLVGGDLTIKGYFTMPDEDREGFTPEGYCRTGDLGYLDREGGLYIKGRKKQIIRVGSYTVLPNEVEEVVLEEPGIAMAAAVGIPHEIYGEVVWLFVKPETGYEIKKEDIINTCSEKLADFKVPRKIVVRREIPVTRIGKADRDLLRKEAIDSLS